MTTGSTPKTKPRAYLAGPMRGYPEFNFPAFHKAAAELRDWGWDVWSPAENDLDNGFDPEKDEAKSLREYMTVDLPEVCKADTVFCLPGWQESEGATLEVHVAHACGIRVRLYRGKNQPSEVILPITEKEESVEIEINRHPLSERFHELLDECGGLHDDKQADYGRDNDPFANVRASEAWGMPAWVGAMVRATDKVRRLQTFARKGELRNESVIDAFMDLAVYALIARVLYEEAA
jgi:hypothetical protein